MGQAEKAVVKGKMKQHLGSNDIEEIVKMIEEGGSMAHIAEAADVGYATIQRIYFGVAKRLTPEQVERLKKVRESEPERYASSAFGNAKTQAKTKKPRPASKTRLKVVQSTTAKKAATKAKKTTPTQPPTAPVPIAAYLENVGGSPKPASLDVEIDHIIDELHLELRTEAATVTRGVFLQNGPPLAATLDQCIAHVQANGGPDACLENNQDALMRFAATTLVAIVRKRHGDH